LELDSPTSISVRLKLVTPDAPAGAQPTPLEPATLAAAAIGLSRFAAGAGYEALNVGVTVSPGGDAIVVALGQADALAAGQVVRLAIDQPLGKPMADTAGRALVPRQWAASFVVREGVPGTLVLGDLPG
jgi:hypothetical protein